MDWGASSDPFKHLDQYLQLLSSDRNRLEPIGLQLIAIGRIQDRLKKDWGPAAIHSSIWTSTYSCSALIGTG